MSKNNKSQNKPVYKFLWRSAGYIGRYERGKITFGMTLVRLCFMYTCTYHVSYFLDAGTKNKEKRPIGIAKNKKTFEITTNNHALVYITFFFYTYFIYFFLQTDVCSFR